VTSYTVTGTATNNTFTGGYLRVEVLTGAQVAGTPATGTSTAAYNCSVTTTQAGSYVLGGSNNETASTAFTAEANCTLFGDHTVNAGGAEACSWRTTSATGTPGATTVGCTTAFAGNYGCAGMEILPNGTIAFDGSTPADVFSTTLTSFTTASFTPPAGSVLVAILTACGNDTALVCVGTVSSSPALTWTEQVKINGTVNAANSYTAVWTAQVPSLIPFASRPYAIQAKRLPGPVAGGITNPAAGGPGIPGPVHGGGFGSAQGSAGGPVLNPPPAYNTRFTRRIAVIPFRAGR
jgi:hypothetical protein